MNRGFRFVAGACAAGAVLGAVFYTHALVAFGAFLDKSEPPQRADVAFVLAGDQTGGRVLRAGQLVKEGYVPKAVVSGPNGLYGYNECDLAIPFAEKAGYPPSYFLRFPNEASSTHEEAAAGTKKLREIGAHRVLLVTSNFHTRRAGNEFRAAAPEIAFIVVSAPDRHFTKDNWWHDREGRKIFLVEWVKTFGEWLHL